MPCHEWIADQPEAQVEATTFTTVIDALRRHEQTLAEMPEQIGLYSAILALPDRQRTVTILHYVLDLDVEDIAQYLERPTATVRSNLRHARERLAKPLGATSPKGAPPGEAPLLPPPPHARTAVRRHPERGPGAGRPRPAARPRPRRAHHHRPPGPHHHRPRQRPLPPRTGRTGAAHPGRPDHGRPRGIRRTARPGQRRPHPARGRRSLRRPALRQRPHRRRRVLVALRRRIRQPHRRLLPAPAPPRPGRARRRRLLDRLVPSTSSPEAPSAAAP
ncbi:hypothetical protein GXW83_24465 [Streptacidiphilus sp. PB12-B1b]|nr:hypothetical protein GXW83_24465 [Streptacidiphilus sp. PB12-B1b]